VEQRNRVSTEWVKEVLDRYEGPLVRYATHLTGNRDHARDVVQETFLRLCRTGQGKIGEHTAGWLYMVCRNLALDHVRKEQRMAPWDEAAAMNLPGRESPPSEEAERAEVRSSLDQLLATLPKNQQEVIRLKFQDSMSYKDISRITGLSVSNVGYLLHVGLKSIRERLASEGEEHSLQTQGAQS